MSSILSCHVAKVYKTINKLDYLFNFPNNFNIDTRLTTGSIHSIFAKLSEEEYTTAYNYYMQKNGDKKDNFYIYDSNRTGIIIDNKDCEYWHWNNNHVVYAYEDNDVCYTIDSFKDRQFFTPATVNDLTLRFIAHGHWFILDDNVKIYLGNQILYNAYSSTEALNTIALNKRIMKNYPNSLWESSLTSSIGEQLYTKTQKFIMFRTVTSYDYLYNKTIIQSIFNSQKLGYLLNPPLNLLGPITS